MNFTNAVELGLKKWNLFSGRASRSEYWFYLLFCWGYAAFVQLSNDYLKSHIPGSEGLIFVLITLAALINMVGMFWVAIGMISVFVRRMHDVNHSGWWYWIVFTIIGALFPLLVWKCSKGTVGDNRFGPDPLQKVLP